MFAIIPLSIKSKLLHFLILSNIICIISYTTKTYHQSFYHHSIKQNNRQISNIPHNKITSKSKLYSSPEKSISLSNKEQFQPSTIPKQKKKQLKPFSRYLEVECWKRQELRSLQPVLQAVSDACKQINRIVQRAQTDDLYGAAVGDDYEVDGDGNIVIETNVQGEVQQKLDVVCNTFMMRALCGSSTDVIMAIASEEEDVVRSCCDVMVCANYHHFYTN